MLPKGWKLRALTRNPAAYAAKELERQGVEVVQGDLEDPHAGSELTNLEAAQVFSRVMGKPVKFRKLPLPLVRLILGKEFYAMFHWFNEAGYRADIAGLHRRYREVHLHTLEEWLREGVGTGAVCASALRRSS